MTDQITVLAGTTKGLFLLRGSEGGPWRVEGPHCEGWPINHAIGDPATGTLWAGGGGDWQGAGIFRSEDDGATWHRASLSDGRRSALRMTPSLLPKADSSTSCSKRSWSNRK